MDVLEILVHDGCLDTCDDGHRFPSRLLKDRGPRDRHAVQARFRIGIDYGPDVEADIPRHRQAVTAVEPSQPLEDQEMRFHTDTMKAKSPPRPTARSGPEDSLSLEFLGCRPITLKLEDLDTHERRFEYWDRDTETAWEVREPTGAGHRCHQRGPALR